MTTSTFARFAAIATLVTAPAMAFAQTKDLKYLINLVAEYFQYAIYLVIALATVVFIWGIYQYFFSADTDKKEALMYVLYGTIGFFVMLSFWGIVNIFRNTIQLDNSKPNIPFVGSTGGTQSNTGGASRQSYTGGAAGQSYTGGAAGQSYTGGTFPGTNVPIQRSYDPATMNAQRDAINNMRPGAAPAPARQSFEETLKSEGFIP